MRYKRFENKAIWITGASSGIGEALAYAFNQAGAHLILSARNREALEKVKAGCANTAKDIHLLPLDLADLALVKKWVAAALNYYGRIDYMIHNAGIALRDLALHTALDVDQKIMNVNYFGPLAITKQLLPSMIKHRSGNIVVVSSLSGKYGVPKLSAYAASKQALHGFFDSLRAEVFKDQIRIMLIIPGIIRTNITVNALKGDGTTYGKMETLQARGMSAEKCAKKMLRAIAKEKEESYIGGPEIITVYLRRFFPHLFSKIIRNHPVKKINQIKKKFLL